MPIPTPEKDEEQSAFIERVMGNETMKKEYPNQKQRLAIAYSQWHDAKKGKSKSKGSIHTSMQ